jgi:hypothetical protein
MSLIFSKAYAIIINTKGQYNKNVLKSNIVPKKIVLGDRNVGREKI